MGDLGWYLFCEHSSSSSCWWWCSCILQDELLWAAKWLHEATGDLSYMNYLTDNAGPLGGTGWQMTEFSWDVKYAGVQVLTSKVGNGDIFVFSPGLDCYIGQLWVCWTGFTVLPSDLGLCHLFPCFSDIVCMIDWFILNWMPFEIVAVPHARKRWAECRCSAKISGKCRVFHVCLLAERQQECTENSRRPPVLAAMEQHPVCDKCIISPHSLLWLPHCCSQEHSVPWWNCAEALDVAAKLSAARSLAPIQLVWKIKRMLREAPLGSCCSGTWIRHGSHSPSKKRD